MLWNKAIFHRKESSGHYIRFQFAWGHAICRQKIESLAFFFLLHSTCFLHVDLSHCTEITREVNSFVYSFCFLKKLWGVMLSVKKVTALNFRIKKQNYYYPSWVSKLVSFVCFPWQDPLSFFDVTTIFAKLSNGTGKSFQT